MRNLKTAFTSRGHHAEIVSIPFQWSPHTQLVRSMLLWRMLDLRMVNGEPIDRVVALKFPAYLVRHPKKVIWMTHQHRQAYDLLGTEFGDLRDDEESRATRRVIADADTRLIPEAGRIFTISKTVAERLRKFNGIRAQPLYHPGPNAGLLRCESYGDYIFYPSRLDRTKRHDLLIKAMAHVKSRVRCILAGIGPEETSLRDLIARDGLPERVKLIGFVSERELIDYYANALAVYFGPFGEDYGYVTLEAFYAKKPVLTLADSGAPLEFVEDGINGMVTSAEPTAIARAIDSLYERKQLAETMGKRGWQTINDLELTWDKVVDTLLS